MTTVIGGSSPAVTFPDSTVQNTAGLPLTGGTLSGTLVVPTISDGTNSTSSTNCIQGSAKAWVRFDASSGLSCTINASYNVSSVTYNSTGNYTINFTNAFADANYSMGASAGVLPGNAGGYLGFVDSSTVPSTTSARVFSNNSAGTPTNFTRLSASFFR